MTELTDSERWCAGSYCGICPATAVTSPKANATRPSRKSTARRARRRSFRIRRRRFLGASDCLRRRRRARRLYACAGLPRGADPERVRALRQPRLEVEHRRREEAAARACVGAGAADDRLEGEEA